MHADRFDFIEKSLQSAQGPYMHENRDHPCLRNNSDSLPNYGRRYRAGRRISSAFVESAVNQLIDKRMSKSQQMRWDPRSAHLLLQVRVRVVDGQLRDDFARWYPAFPSNDPTLSLLA